MGRAEDFEVDLTIVKVGKLSKAAPQVTKSQYLALYRLCGYHMFIKAQIFLNTLMSFFKAKFVVDDITKSACNFKVRTCSVSVTFSTVY